MNPCDAKLQIHRRGRSNLWIYYRISSNYHHRRNSQAGQWHQEYLKGQCCAVAQLISLEEEKQEEIPDQIRNMLQKLEDVSHEPQGLPPIRPQDHKISLQKGAQAVNIRSYSYTEK